MCFPGRFSFKLQNINKSENNFCFRTKISRFPEQPEKTLNLSHIVPPSPLPSHNGFDSGLLAPFDRSSTLDSRATGRSLDSAGASLNRASTSNDEEHRLIARYAARLAQESRTPASSSENASLAPDNSQAQRQLIAQLESKNKEIMREIARLRRQQEAEQLNQESPALMNELRALRQRKGELEVRKLFFCLTILFESMTVELFTFRF